MDWIQRLKLPRQHRWVFYGVFLLLQLALAGMSGLMDDETYYWMYANYPDTGYFDHPPMIAWLIKMGTLLFPGSLGVRFWVVMLSVGTIWLIDEMTRARDPKLFYAVVVSIALLQIGGVLAVPDIPLMFFTAWFFYVYQQFLKKETVFTALLLGLSMALLLWSKYHGVLILFFTFLSNPKMVLRPLPWVAVFLGVVLFAPHLYWQYQHDFPSVQFHLFERNEPAYKIKFTLEYLSGQLVLFGPFIAWLLWWTATRNRERNLFHRALRFSFWGIYLFFLLNTLKGRVEANWTLPALVPTLLLAQPILESETRWRKWVAILFWPAILLTTTVRVYMMQDSLKWAFIKKDELHQNEKAMKQIQSLAGDHPVVFINSYQLASKFKFYEQKDAFSMNEVFYRRNNYNFWPLEAPLLGKKVLVLKGGEELKDGILTTPRGVLSYQWEEKYYSFSQVDIRLKSGRNIRWTAGQPALVDIQIDCPPSLVPALQSALPQEQLKLFLFNAQDQITDTLNTGLRLPDIVAGKQLRTIRLESKQPAGSYFAKFAMPTSLPRFHSLNSGILRVEIK